MRSSQKRWLITFSIAGVIALGPWLLWEIFNHEPEFYARLNSVEPEQRLLESKKFVSTSLQLRNDLVNEANWEATFSEQEINSWITEELLARYGEYVPKEVHDPRIHFERDRLFFAFRYEQGALSSIIWATLKVQVPDNNTIALTFEKIQAGLIPVSAQDVLSQIDRQALNRGVHVAWDTDQGHPRAIIRYQPVIERKNLVLKQIQLTQGKIRLSGVSTPSSKKTDSNRTTQSPSSDLAPSLLPPVPIDDKEPERSNSTNP